MQIKWIISSNKINGEEIINKGLLCNHKIGKKIILSFYREGSIIKGETSWFNKYDS